MTHLRAPDEMGVVAARNDGAKEEIIGIARFLRTGPDHAEVDFAVADAHHGRGIGTHLLEALASLGRENGIKVFAADVLLSNRPMLDVFEQSGFKVERTTPDNVAQLTFAIDETERSRMASDQRFLISAAKSLRPILKTGTSVLRASA